MTTTSLQEQQAPLDRAIVTALIGATPDEWNIAILNVERLDEGALRLQVDISSPEGHPPVMATDDLFEALYGLADLYRSHGAVWKKVSYRAEINPSGNWGWSADFTY